MPLDREDQQAIRDRHQQHVCAGHAEPGICVHCADPWPCDVTRLLDVADEAVNFTVVWQEVLPYAPDDYGFTMQCVEAEAAAGLFRALGDTGTAESILDAHAVHDTEEDQHYDRGDQVRRARVYAEERSDQPAGRGDPVPGS